MTSSRTSAKKLNQEIDEVLRMRQRKAGVGAFPRVGQGSRSPGIPSQAEYERRELNEAHRRLEEVQRTSLADRKEAQASFLEAMREFPGLVAERIGWLLDEHYGYGAMLLAKRILASPRMNRSAALTQMIGALEWQSPEILTRSAWKMLTTDQKASLESAVRGAIDSALSEE